MTHLRVLSRKHAPAKAQFETIFSVIGIIQALMSMTGQGISLLEQIDEAFGTNLIKEMEAN